MLFRSIILTMLFVPLLSAILLQFASASPLAKRGISGPVISADFKDPSIVKPLDVTTPGSWIAYSSSSGGLNIPTAQGTADLKTWSLRGVDALPTVGAWSTGNNVLSPDVILLVSLGLGC